MKILTSAQIREADAFTIEHENLGPAELMERAAMAFANWFEANCNREKEVAVFCGPGNNGGDGLAIARLLFEKDFLVRTFLPETGSVFSADMQLNLERLPPNVPLIRYKNISQLAPYHLAKNRIVDALFGTGLNRTLSGLFADTIHFLNESGAEIISVDMPSGLFADEPTPAEAPIIKATHTVTFSAPKLALLLPQNQTFSGHFHTVPIGLNIPFFNALLSQYFFTTSDEIKLYWKPRPQFAHKGTFGHALLLSGSYGKLGAAVLAAKACLRSGVGLLSVAIPACGYQILQTTVPEAMVLPDTSEKHLAQLPPEPEKYAAIGMGPGIGQETETKQVLRTLLTIPKVTLVLDADALNILSADKSLMDLLPEGTILTPHPKEFERLIGPARDDFHRLYLLRDFCARHKCYVVLKGAYSCIGTPEGSFFFNSTGNPGMATGGSGDALTGIITALRAQQYPSEEAAILGVYVHGLAGDFAKEALGETTLIASDIIAYLGQAFKTLEEITN